MRIFLLLIVIFSLLNCQPKKDGNGINIGIRNNNGDTLSFSSYDYENEDYEFYDSENEDSIFHDKKIMSKMPGRFGLGIKNKKGKPYMYLTFVANPILTVGKNYDDRYPIFGEEYSLTNYFTKVVDIRYDSSRTSILLEDQLLAAIDKNSKDTLLYQEQILIIKNNERDKILGGYFAVFDNKNTRKEMKEIFEGAIKEAASSMKSKK